MRWPWQKPRPSPCRSSDDADEAVQARLKAEEDLRLTHEKTAEVRALAEQLRRHRRVNHFAELFGRTFEGGQR
jgi:hypothetical protein